MGEVMGKSMVSSFLLMGVVVKYVRILSIFHWYFLTR